MTNMLRVLLVLLLVNFALAQSQTEITQVKIFSKMTNADLESAVNDFLKQIWYYEVVSIEYYAVTKWSRETYFLAMIVYKKPWEKSQ